MLKKIERNYKLIASLRNGYCEKMAYVNDFKFLTHECRKKYEATAQMYLKGIQRLEMWNSRLISELFEYQMNRNLAGWDVMMEIS